MRYGTLLRESVYLIHKWYDADGRKHREVHTAPAGTRIEWDEDATPNTNAGYEDAYGDRFLYWINLAHPSGGVYGSIGAEVGVDFEWES